jgi:hypothetical protein
MYIIMVTWILEILCGCQLSPRCMLVSNLGGMGSGHLWGPFASFLLVRGDDGDLPEPSASVLRLTSPVLLGSLARKVRRTAVLTPGTAHFELRQLDHLGTNGNILETDTPRQAAGWRFLLYYGVEDLARYCMSEPSSRARGRRADATRTREYCCRAALSVMHVRAVSARARTPRMRPVLPYSSIHVRVSIVTVPTS